MLTGLGHPLSASSAFPQRCSTWLGEQFFTRDTWQTKLPASYVADQRRRPFAALFTLWLSITQAVELASRHSTYST
jgi:hypothetical protein